MTVTHSATESSTPQSTLERVFSFPNPVNEKAARTVAGGVLLIAVLTLILSITAGHGWLWVCAVLAAGFLARVLTGPTLSPLGQLATRVLAPRLGAPKQVAGPPKRFAQAIGLVVTGGATLAVALGHPLGAQILLALIIVAAGLESIFAICLGCIIFNRLMRAGLIPEETCEACSNISLRYSHS
jgi:MFS family permease